MAYTIATMIVAIEPDKAKNARFQPPKTNTTAMKINILASAARGLGQMTLHAFSTTYNGLGLAIKRGLVYSHGGPQGKRKARNEGDGAPWSEGRRPGKVPAVTGRGPPARG